MRTRDEFADQFADELAGLLLSAFTAEDSTKLDYAGKGRFVQMQLRKVRPLLVRMHEFAAGQQDAGAMAAQLAKLLPTCSKDVQESVKQTLRAAFAAPQANGKAS